ncbi:MAG: hypothetical protein ACI9U2_001500 [Bradymonadia bacterium]|jgi:hypothetical protein
MTTPETRMRAWIDSMVIGLGLCPFAQRVVRAEQVRYVTTEAADLPDLLAILAAEMAAISGDAPGFETTLILAPAFADFDDYLDALALADGLIVELDLEGVVQVASFHPDYRFAGAPADDVAHFTNRAPIPTFHLLREADVERAVADHPDAEGIAAANIAQLRALGLSAITDRLRGI